MTELLAVLITVGIVFGYGLFAGVTYGLIRDEYSKELGAALWPLVLPAVAGIHIVKAVKARTDCPKLPPARVR